MWKSFAECCFKWATILNTLEFLKTLTSIIFKWFQNFLIFHNKWLRWNKRKIKTSLLRTHWEKMLKKACRLGDFKKRPTSWKTAMIWENLSKNWEITASTVPQYSGIFHETSSGMYWVPNSIYYKKDNCIDCKTVRSSLRNRLRHRCFSCEFYEISKNTFGRLLMNIPRSTESSKNLANSKSQNSNISSWLHNNICSANFIQSIWMNSVS